MLTKRSINYYRISDNIREKFKTGGAPCSSTKHSNNALPWPWSLVAVPYWKNTWKWKWKRLHSHVWLFANPTDCSPVGSFVHGILYGRILRVAIPFSRESSWPRQFIRQLHIPSNGTMTQLIIKEQHHWWSSCLNQILNWTLQTVIFLILIIPSIMNKSYLFLRNVMTCSFFFLINVYSQLPSFFSDAQTVPNLCSRRPFKGTPVSFWHNLTSFWMIHCFLAQWDTQCSLLLFLNPDLESWFPLMEKEVETKIQAHWYW